MRHDKAGRDPVGQGLRWCVLGAMLVAALCVPAAAAAQTTTLTINVADVDASPPPIGGFYYTVEEDNTQLVVPGVLFDPLSPEVNITRSHSNLLASGVSAGSSVQVTIDSTKRYYVSALPWQGGPPVGNGPAPDAVSSFTLGGAPVAAGQTSVTVKVHSTPIPTAQIFVLAFEDNSPINGAPDQPSEAGLPGFTVQLTDTLGRVSQDAFGNPLGTTYQQNPNGSFVLGANGLPIVNTLGTGAVTTDASGQALIKFLFPGKYGVRITPPTSGPDSDMIQTATIEGTPSQDNWVMAGEPPYFNEGGLTSWHTFIGFVHPMQAPGGSGTITGRYDAVHESPPPAQNAITVGPAIPQGWVGLSDLGKTNEEQIYAEPTNPDGTFTISGVPPGNYLLSVWDSPNLDYIIDYRNVTIPPTGGTVALGDVAVFAWFGHMEGHVFVDANGNGQMDPGEAGISQVPVKLRFTDGSLTPGGLTVTDSTGFYAFDEVFPWFHWVVAEVDNTRFKPTGATMVVDAGGGPLPDPNKLQNPQLQPSNGNLPSRTETTPAPGATSSGVLTEAMLDYADQTNTIDWGKAYYAPGQNGGIYGIVSYDTTRAEDNPQYGTQEFWQPGIPRVIINLYASDSSGNITNATPIQTTQTTSWDDHLPTGCVGPPQTLPNGTPIMNCADDLRTWNQLRPGVYDGMYAFTGLAPGYYVVQVVPPPGYEVVHIEDRNIFFGAAPTPYVVPPLCVGDTYTVPQYEQLFPGQQIPVPAPYAGSQAQVCDRKLAVVRDGQNFNANFFLFTGAPVAGRIWGVVLNDTTLEFNPASPQYGNNLGASFLPISIKDYAGVEVNRFYSDQWGRYNGLAPSTYTINPPDPSGVAPNIVQVVMNDPGPIPDPNHPGSFITDPFYNPSYQTISTELDIWPGTTLTADTPILPVAAFTASTSPLDCEAPDKTPYIKQVDGSGSGPYLVTTPGVLTLTAVGPMTVANPDYDPTVPGSPTTIVRDYGFGATQGTVTLNGVKIPDANVNWSNLALSVTIPAGSVTGELLVTRGDSGNTSPMGITLHIGDTNVVHVGQGQSIQTAVDNATPGELIMVGPGTFNENVIVWKKVQIQGTGAFSTQLQVPPLQGDQTTAWQAKMTALETSGAITLVPGERADFYLETGGGFTLVGKNDGSWDNNPPAMVDGFDIEGAIQGGGVFVNAYNTFTHVSNNRIRANQGSLGGGIRVGTPTIVCATPGTCAGQFESSHNEDMVIAYNQINQNGAIDGGGGVAIFTGADRYQFVGNDVCGNFTLQYGGGMVHQGVSNGARVSRNVFLNNQSFDEGGGFMIVGETVPAANVASGYLSDGCGSVNIDKNLFEGNQGGDDGGAVRLMAVNGEDVRQHPADPTQWYQTLITNNVMTNNVSGDLGGAIAMLDAVNTDIINNTIVHNDSTSTSQDSFGGPCIPAAPPGQACPEPSVGGGGLTNSIPQVGGIAAQLTSSGLQTAMATSPVPATNKEYSNPVLHDNIIWQNRSFWWDANANGGFGGLQPRSAIAGFSDYWDLAVYTPDTNYMDPQYSILTTMDRGDGTQFSPTNVAADPALVNTLFNTYLATSKGAALGNTVTVVWKPLGRRGDAHLTSASPARGLGGGVFVASLPQLQLDYDLAPRPTGTVFDSGASQFVSAAAGTADLGITDVGSPQGVVSGVATALTYTVTVTNIGPSAASGVTINDTLPSGASGVSAAVSQGSITVSSNSVVAASVGAMNSGATVALTIQLTLTTTVQASNSASVASGTVDPNLANNSATATTSVFAALSPVLNVRILSNSLPGPNAGTNLTFTWDPPASAASGCGTVVYDVLQSSNPADFVTAATCVATGVTVTTAPDDDLVPMNPGEVRYYLVRDRDACGSNLGTASDGTPRQGRTCP